jgi:hypothetical protein
MEKSIDDGGKLQMRKIILPLIFRPYLTIVNSCLYYFRLLGLLKVKNRLIYQPEQGD